MSSRPRLVVAGTRGPDVADELILEPAFGIATAAAHLRDALARMRQWSAYEVRFVAKEGTSQIAVDEVERALDLLDKLNKQGERDGDGE